MPLKLLQTLRIQGIEALHNIDRIRYILSVLAEGTESERTDAIIQQREEVIKLEQRISGIAG